MATEDLDRSRTPRMETQIFLFPFRSIEEFCGNRIVPPKTRKLVSQFYSSPYFPQTVRDINEQIKAMGMQSPIPDRMLFNTGAYILERMAPLVLRQKLSKNYLYLPNTETGYVCHTLISGASIQRIEDYNRGIIGRSLPDLLILQAEDNRTIIKGIADCTADAYLEQSERKRTQSDAFRTFSESLTESVLHDPAAAQKAGNIISSAFPHLSPNITVAQDQFLVKHVFTASIASPSYINPSDIIHADISSRNLYDLAWKMIGDIELANYIGK